MELVRLEDLQKTYHLGEVDVPVLRGISLTIQRGEIVAVIGASGSGKTTLMNILGCLDRPSSGRYWLDGQEMTQLTPNERALVRTAKLGFVFQSFNLLLRTSALHNVLMPLDYAVKRFSAAEARGRARELLDHLGLADRATTSRRKCQVGNNSGWRSPARWSTAPCSSWPTSRRATSIRTPASTFCGCSSGSTPRTSRLSW